MKGKERCFGQSSHETHILGSPDHTEPDQHLKLFILNYEVSSCWDPFSFYTSQGAETQNSSEGHQKALHPFQLLTGAGIHHSKNKTHWLNSHLGTDKGCPKIRKMALRTCVLACSLTEQTPNLTARSKWQADSSNSLLLCPSRALTGTCWGWIHAEHEQYRGKKAPRRGVHLRVLHLSPQKQHYWSCLVWAAGLWLPAVWFILMWAACSVTPAMWNLNWLENNLFLSLKKMLCY